MFAELHGQVLEAAHGTARAVEHKRQVLGAQVLAASCLGLLLLLLELGA